MLVTQIWGTTGYLLNLGLYNRKLKGYDPNLPTAIGFASIKKGSISVQNRDATPDRKTLYRTTLNRTTVYRTTLNRTTADRNDS